MCPDRAALVETHLALVHAIAVNLMRRLPASVELDDLVQDGRVGLLLAALSYQPERQPSFGMYAKYRIKGAMLDRLRRGNWAHVVAEEFDPDSHGGATEFSLDGLADRQVARELRRALDYLPVRERGILAAHYGEGLTFREIGQRMGCSGEWVGQLHRRAIGQLRARLGHIAPAGDSRA